MHALLIASLRRLATGARTAALVTSVLASGCASLDDADLANDQLTPAAQAQAQALPPPPRTLVTAEGSGCPPGSWVADIDLEDDSPTSVSVYFTGFQDDFRTPGAPRTRSCRLTVRLDDRFGHFFEGWSVSLSTTQEQRVRVTGTATVPSVRNVDVVSQDVSGKTSIGRATNLPMTCDPPQIIQLDVSALLQDDTPITGGYRINGVGLSFAKGVCGTRDGGR